jgi:hypothetical protein
VTASLNQSGHADLGGPGFHQPSRTNSSLSGVPSNSGATKPLISLDGAPGPAQPQQPQQSLAGSGMPGRTGIPYMDNSRDSASVASGPQNNTSMRSSSSSIVRPPVAFGPGGGNRTYQQEPIAGPRSGGHATGV